MRKIVKSDEGGKKKKKKKKKIVDVLLSGEFLNMLENDLST